MPATFEVIGLHWCFRIAALALLGVRRCRPAFQPERRLFSWLIALTVLATSQVVHAQPSYTVSADQLQQALAQRFPMRYQVPGLLDFDVQTPQLRMLQAENRMRAEMAIAAAGPALRRAYQGTFDVDFALRYEPGDRTIRAYRLRLGNLRLADLPPQASELLSSYGTAIAAQALQEVVLHQLRPQDLAIPDSLGMQPDSITVTNKGLVIGFMLKPL